MSQVRNVAGVSSPGVPGMADGTYLFGEAGVEKEQEQWSACSA